MSEAIKDIIDAILKGKVKTKKELNEYKIFVCKKYKLKKFPSNPEILENAGKKKKKIIKILKIKPVRTVSGVAVVAVMTSPFPCPHGKCIYCPGGIEYGAPQSYIGDEPALMRAVRHNYHPYRQVQARLKQYYIIGHLPQKIELILMGGTFLSFPLDYQEWFVTQCFRGINEFFLKKKEWISLEKAQKQNEKAYHKCVGLTIETRPDWGKEKHADRILKYGGTRVEVGVQTIYPKILKNLERGHTIKDTIESTRILKDSGFKILYQIMPGLPGSSYKMDLQMFKEIFKNQDFKPDMLKIYPTLVMKGTKLHEMWKKGEYNPLDIKTTIKLVSEIKKYMPKYVRIMRIQRDIPENLISAGPKISNLRQVVERRGVKCQCIRCREVGHKYLKEKKIPKKIDIIKTEYKASKGKEIFISAEDVKQDILIGFCRLRFPFKSHRKEINEKTAIVRELHVFGPLAEIGKKSLWQHKGLGKKLLKTAEQIARNNNKNKMIIISGIGVRKYYSSKMGYKLEGSYMSKNL